jgi:hypothetical protein
MRPLSSLPLFGSPVEEPTRNRPRESTCYSYVPGTRDVRHPSKDASTTIYGATKNLWARALSCIVRSPAGLTADEEQLGKSPFSVRPRIAELRCRGVVEPSEHRRRNASGVTVTVWRLAKLLGCEREEGSR